MKNMRKVLAVVLASQMFFSMAQADKFHYDRHDKRDPFFVSSDRPQALESNAQTPVNFKLEGVILDPNGASMAIINGDIAKLGDQVGSFRIKQITKQGVLFSSSERDFWVPIRTEE